jgi:hypothetical protein
MSDEKPYCDFKDFFYGISEKKTSKIVGIIFSITSAPIIALLLYSIIWYEKYGLDKKRTLLNKLVSSICWTAIAGNTFVQIPRLVRSVTCPFPELACFFGEMLRRQILTQYFLFLDGIMITRYVYIFWLKNPTAFHDDFWWVVINIWVVGFSFIFEFVRAILPGRQPIWFYACAGTDPTIGLNLHASFGGFLEVFSLFVHGFVYLKISILKWQEKKSQGPQTYDTFLKSMTLSEVQNESLSTIGRNVCQMLVISSVFVNGVIVNRMSSDSESFNQFPGYLFLHYTFLVYPGMSTLLLALVYLLQHQPLKKTVKQEMKRILNIHQSIPIITKN